MKNEKILIIAPVYNEEDVVEHFFQEVNSIFSSMNHTEFIILFVVDRCTDNTLEILKSLQSSHDHIQILKMSSRFGHQAALQAGISQSDGYDAVIMMDSDLQHPPELIPKMINHFRDGIEIVYTIRQENIDSSFFRKIFGNLYYFLLNLISDVPVLKNAADYRLLSARVTKVIREQVPEKNIFFRGFIPWVGFSQIGLTFKANTRYAGDSKYSITRMFSLGILGFLSTSTKPLMFGLLLGSIFVLISFIMFFWILFSYITSNEIPSGWTTLALLQVLFGGIQLTISGILGLYIGILFKQSLGRPAYVIEEKISKYKKN